MSAIIWTPRNRGTVNASPTNANPDRVQLAATHASWARFEGSNLPAGAVLDFHAQATGDFRLTVDVETTAGTRRFAFYPGETRTRRMGSRYFVGLGRAVRAGRRVNDSIDLQAIVSASEPNVRVLSIRRVFIGVAAALLFVLGERVLVPPPPDPTSGPPNPNEPPTPQDPPQDPRPEPPPGNAPAGPSNRNDAFRFLTQASFGASPATIDQLMNVGSYNTWIDSQLAMEPSLTEPFVRANSNGSLGTTRHHIWWNNAMEGQDQLRQRLAFAWSEIFVVSDRDYVLSNAQYGMCNYYDLLAAGSTGNFRDLLETVTLHPVMGVYLSMVRNERADPARNIRPDENFAREVLQLFTIGLHELEADGTVRMRNGAPIPAFDQRSVEEFAKLFTGWNFGGSDVWVSTNTVGYDKQIPMEPWEEYHEPEAKELLNGTRVAAGGTARADLTAALDNIFNHANVGPFIAKQLIQRLVTSNPTPVYVGRVAAVFNNDGSGERGNLEAVSRAILTDVEARNGHQTLPQRFGKIKEPIMRLTNLWRAFDAQPGVDSTSGHRPYARPVSQLGQVLGQMPLDAHHVFNFFPPKYPLAPGSDMVAPELAILSEINVAVTNNMLFQQVYLDNNRSNDRLNITRIQIEPEVAMAANPTALVDHLNDLLAGGAVPADYRAALVAQLQVHPSDADGLLARATDAIYGIVGSPFHLVQK